MKLLVASDGESSAQMNPYVAQLLIALEQHSGGVNVQHGPFWFWVVSLRFDIVHIQWPEALFGWTEPTDEELAKLEATLKRRKACGTKIVVTVHNEFPHGRDTDRFSRLYRVVYQAADGFIHLGQSSIEILLRRHATVVAGKEHRVIHHGDYSWYENSTTKRDARERLGLESGVTVVLGLGSIRSQEELRLMIDGFNCAKLPEALLLVAGRLPSPSRRQVKHYVLRFPFLWGRQRMRLDEGKIPAARIQDYLNAADVLLISRIHSLNSGNVALAFHFGRTVVGPDIGVIGEQLRLTGNPVYRPDSPGDLGRALTAGVNEARSGRGETNRIWAQEHMDWDLIARQHVEFYCGLQGGYSLSASQPKDIEITR